MKMQGVYCWLNLMNGKVYVGSSVDIEFRKREHVWQLNRNAHINIHLQHAWKSYGSDNFEFIVLEVVEDELWLRAREQAWIVRTQCQDPEFGYNTLCDAWTPSKHRIGTHHSEASRARLRAAWVERKKRGEVHVFTAEDSAKGIAAALKVHQENPTRWKQGISKAQKKSWTPERRAAHTERMRFCFLNNNPNLKRIGKKLPEEWKANLRVAWARRQQQSEV